MDAVARVGLLESTNLIVASAMAGDDILGEISRQASLRHLTWTGDSGGRMGRVEEETMTDIGGVKVRLGTKATATHRSAGYGQVGRQDWGTIDAITMWTGSAKRIMPLA